LRRFEARYVARPFFVWCQHGEDRELVTAAHKAEHPEQWTGGQPIFVGWAVGTDPREEFCTRASLERILPAVRRAIARRRNDPPPGAARAGAN
jgi:hypothetical protein